MRSNVAKLKQVGMMRDGTRRGFGRRQANWGRQAPKPRMLGIGEQIRRVSGDIGDRFRSLSGARGKPGGGGPETRAGLDDS